MVPQIECHITQNYPGPGWYWEVIIETARVFARGLTDSRAEAESQAAEAMRLLNGKNANVVA